MKADFEITPHLGSLRKEERAWRIWARRFLGLVFLAFVVCTVARLDSPILRTEDDRIVEHVTLRKDLNATRILKALYAPILVPVDTAAFADHRQVAQKLQSHPSWTSNQGKKICIVSVARAGHLDGFVGAGILSHYAYASIHGYQYHAVEGTPSLTSEQLAEAVDELFTKDCETVIMMKENLGLENLNVPAEWLLNRWKIQQGAPLATTTTSGHENDIAMMVVQNAGWRTESLFRNCLSRDRHGDDSSTCPAVASIPSSDVPSCTNEWCVGLFARGGWTMDDLDESVLGGGVIKNLVPRLYKEYILSRRTATKVVKHSFRTGSGVSFPI